MKIALPWSHNDKYHYADEYNLSFDSNKNKFENLFIFLQEHKDIRFNLSMRGSPLSLDSLKILVQSFPHLYFRIQFGSDIYGQLADINAKFFFDADQPATSFCLLDELCSYDITDVYIADDLCYQLEKVRKYADIHHLQVRMILNQIPSTIKKRGMSITSPWFIPETVDQLSQYVDVGEFVSENFVELDTLYNIWYNKKRFREDLRFINKDIRLEIPNQCLIPDFTIFKMNCGHRCLYEPVCNKCSQFHMMALDLYSKDIEYNLKEYGIGEFTEGISHIDREYFEKE